MPVLLEHFVEHNKEGMSWGEFIHIHYVCKQEKDADYETDMKLPFKVLTYSHLLSISIPPAPIQEQEHAPDDWPPVVKYRNMDLSQFYISPFLQAVWNPPRPILLSASC